MKLREGLQATGDNLCQPGIHQCAGDGKAGAEQEDNLVGNSSGIFPVQKTHARHKHQQAKTQHDQFIVKTKTPVPGFDLAVEQQQ